MRKPIIIFENCEQESFLHTFIGKKQYTVFISHCKSDKEEWWKYLLYEEHCCSTNTLIGIFDSFDDAALKVENIVKENILDIKNNLHNQLNMLDELEKEITNGS
jgi:hypothetical protein